jgi:hypothetical protein
MAIHESNLGHLSADELHRLAAAHIDAIHGELSAATSEVREAWSPTKLARKHPVATAAIVAAVAAGGGVLVARMLKRRGTAQAPADNAEAAATEDTTSAAVGGQPSVNRIFTTTLISTLAAVASQVLPALLLTMLDSHARKRPQE